MSLKRRGGKWYYRFWRQGNEIQRTTGLDATERNRSTAEAMEAQAKLEILAGRGLPRAPRFQLFEAAAKEYLAHCDATMKHSTAARIRTSFASLIECFHGIPVCSIGAAAVQDYKAWRLEKHRVRAVTVRHDLHTLGAFYRRWALERNLASENPLTAVKIPSDADAQRQHVLTRAEETAYMAATRRYPELFDLAALMLLTGCRPDELYSLPKTGVNIRARTLTIAGGKSRAARRVLPLVDDAVMILRRRMRRMGEWVFPSPRIAGQHLTKLNNQHDEACRDAGVSFTLYDLRHTWATRMVTEAGVDVATVAALLGHSSLRTVMRYVHSQAETRKAAMDAYGALLQRQKRRTRTGTGG